MTEKGTTYSKGVPVKLVDVENHLRSLWKNIARDSKKTVMRASTLTLIVIHRERKKFEQYQETLMDVTSHHPGRLVHVLIDPSRSQENINAAVSALCRMPGNGDNRICCEQVVFKTGPAGEIHISGAVIPLLLPALPVYVVVTDPALVRSNRLASLFQMADKMIFDFSLKTGGLPATPALMLKTNENIAIGDLKWAAFADWRRSVMPLFDGAEGKKYRETINHLVVTPGAGYKSLFMLGWIVSRFNWDIDGAGNNMITFTDKKNRSIQAFWGPGDGRGIIFKTDENICLGSLRENKKYVSFVEKKNSRVFEQQFSMGQKQVSCLLCSELDDTSTHAVYRDSLVAARQICEVFRETYQD